MSADTINFAAYLSEAAKFGDILKNTPGATQFMVPKIKIKMPGREIFSQLT